MQSVVDDRQVAEEHIIQFNQSTIIQLLTTEDVEEAIQEGWHHQDEILPEVITNQ